MINCSICGEKLDFYTEEIVVEDDEYCHESCLHDEGVVVMDVDTFMKTKYQRIN